MSYKPSRILNVFALVSPNVLTVCIFVTTELELFLRERYQACSQEIVQG